MNEINKKLFLQELSELSRKYEIYIGGCGCCGSPYLTDDEYSGSGDLEWNREKKEYDYEE